VVLDAYRNTADVVLQPLATRLAHVHPDVFTWTAFGCALLAGTGFLIGGTGFLLLGVLGVLGNALFDALDGKVARVAGRASRRGDFLDHVLDRYADVFMLAGIAFGVYSGNLALGLISILGVLLASYMGTQAQAVGVGRDYGGLLGRADRLVILLVAGILQLFVPPTTRLGISPLLLSPLEWSLALFAVLGHFTAIQRALTAWERLGGR